MATANHKQKDRFYHDAVAAEYDEVIVKPRRFTNDLIFKKYARYLKEGQTQRGLDLGCGTGHMTLRFGSYFDSIDAVDGSAAMLTQAKKNLAASSVEVNFYQSDFVDFLSGVQADDYDAVFCTGFLHHLPLQELGMLLKELHRVIRTGGILLVSEPIKVTGQAPSEITEWNAKAQGNLKPYSPEVHARSGQHLDTDEEPLDKEAFIELLSSSGFRLARQTQSWEIYPIAASYIRNYFCIRSMFNRSLGTGNVLTVLAYKQ